MWICALIRNKSRRTPQPITLIGPRSIPHREFGRSFLGGITSYRLVRRIWSGGDGCSVFFEPLIFICHGDTSFVADIVPSYTRLDHCCNPNWCKISAMGWATMLCSVHCHRSGNRDKSVGRSIPTLYRSVRKTCSRSDWR